MNPTPVPIDLFFVKSKSKNRNSTKESSISSVPSSLPSTVKSNSSCKPPHHIGGLIGGNLDQSDLRKKRRKMNSKNRIKPFSTLQMIYKKPWHFWRFMTITFCSVQPNIYLDHFIKNNSDINGAFLTLGIQYECKQKQENKGPLRCASLRGVEFFPMEKEEREGAAFGTFVLLFIFTQWV